MKPNWYSERLPAFSESANAPELVLLHGWGMSSAVWRHWLPLLRRRCNVILLDLPGFGCSPAQNNLSIEALLDQLAYFIPRGAAVLGWSLGGTIALAFTARFPDHCAALMTLACNPCFVEKTDWPAAMPAQLFQQFQNQLNENSAATLRRFLSLQTRGSDGEKELLRWVRALPQADSNSAALAWGLALLRQLDVRTALQHCALPAVHIYGSVDALVPAALYDAVVALAPRHWMVLLDGAAHLPFVSHAELCWQHLDRLLKSAGLQTRPRAPQRDKHSVAASFSRAAASYDDAAQLQRDVARELLALVDAPANSVVLDLGCGTGAATMQLAQKYSVIGLDLAEGMLHFAKKNAQGNVQWLCGDAENLPLADASVAAVFSSLAVQWCENIGALFAEIQRVLQPGGSAWISTLGPNTLFELREAWQKADDRVHVNAFAARAAIEDAVRRSGLTLSSWREDNVVLRYAELRQLTRELKAIGAHNVNSGRPDGLTSRQRVQAFSAAYETQRYADGLLPATYQVWYLRVTREAADA